MANTKNGRKVALVAGLALVVLSVAMAWTFWEEIRFFLKFESLGRNAQGYLEYLHRRTRIVMVSVPGGTFEMGSPEDEEGRRDDEQQHEVSLSPFLIGKYEVTQTEWSNVMGSNPSARTGEKLPVENVSWNTCQEFCKRTEMSLPSEAQWEYACRAGTAGRFSGTGVLDETGWHKGNSGNKLHPVGKKAPNHFGLYDMHGNVKELCLDVYERGFYRVPEASASNPVCHGGSEQRVMRGGCFFVSEKGCRSAARNRTMTPTDEYGNVGFRPAYYLP